MILSKTGSTLLVNSVIGNKEISQFIHFCSGYRISEILTRTIYHVQSTSKNVTNSRETHLKICVF